jgi:glycosyltransferase involved in cell wall biosynthesis
MDVVMLCESAEVTGGAERVAILEALELRKRGFRVGYIAAGNVADPRLISSGVEVLLLNVHSFYETSGVKNKLTTMFFNPNVQEPIAKFLSTFSAGETIFHAHTYRLKLSGKAVQTAQTLGFKTVIHGHDYSPICPTSLYFDHRLQIPCEKKPLSLPCLLCECQGEPAKYKLPKTLSALTNAKFFGIYKKAGLFLHVSQQEMDVVSRYLPSGNHKLITAPHEIEQLPRVCAEQNHAYTYIGRLTPEKEPGTFLEACRQAGVLATVIGEGRLRGELESSYPEAKFLGWLRDEALTNAIASARCLIVPSKWKETYGLSVADCMSRGVPCIVSDRVGAKDLIQSDNHGQIFASSNPESLLSAINVYKSDAILKEHSQNAYDSIWAAPPTVSRHVDQLITEYQKLLEIAS